MIATAEPITEVQQAKANGDAPAALGTQTGSQGPLNLLAGNTLIAGGGFFFGPGGTTANPLNFPGWLTGGYAGTFEVYRWILAHPMVRAVRERVFGTICATGWAVEADEDVDEEVVKAVTCHFGKVRDASMPEFLRCLDYGASKFEAVWEQDEDGLYWVTFKPLWPDWTAVYANGAGDFTGFGVNLRQDLTDQQKAAVEATKVPTDAIGQAQPNLPAALFKALLITYDGEGGNLHGRSQLENIRLTAWVPWLLAMQQLAALGAMLSGRQAYGVAPVATLPDGSTCMDQVKLGLEAFARGENPVIPGFYIEQVPGDGSPPKQIPAVEFKTADFGSRAEAINGLLKQLAFCNELIWHGYLQSPRSGMMTQSGDRATSEQHTANDTLFCERLAHIIAGRVQPFVDEVARLNWRLKPGKVRLVQLDIQDPLQVFRQQAITTGLNSSTAGEEVAGRVDWEKTLKKSGMDTREYTPPLQPDPNRPPAGDQQQGDNPPPGNADKSNKPAAADAVAK